MSYADLVKSKKQMEKKDNPKKSNNNLTKKDKSITYILSLGMILVTILFFFLGDDYSLHLSIALVSLMLAFLIFVSYIRTKSDYDKSIFNEQNLKTFVVAMIVIVIIALFIDDKVTDVFSLAMTTSLIGIRMIWYALDYKANPQLKLKNLVLDEKREKIFMWLLMLLGINAIFQFLILVFDVDIYESLYQQSSLFNDIESDTFTQMVGGILFGVIPLIWGIPILNYYRHWELIKVEDKIMKGFKIPQMITGFWTAIIVSISLYFIIAWADNIGFGVEEEAMIYSAQSGTNYFSYVFYILLQSPAPALMIAFMVFSSIALMLLQNVEGIGMLGSVASGIIVIIPMLFVISIFTGSIPPPDLLVEILGRGTASMVFGLAEVSAFLFMLAIIAVFAQAGRLMGSVLISD